MTTYLFNALTSGQAISFDPDADLLSFDVADVAAADIKVTYSGADTHIKVTGGAHAGKEIILLDMAPRELGIANVAFADGSQLLFGGRGDDSLNGGDGDDQLRGFGGDDTLVGGNGDDVLRGGAGDDSLVGGFGSDLLKGGSGDDILRQGGLDLEDGDIDTLDGGLGDDTYIINEDPFQETGDLVLLDAGGVDTLISNNNASLPTGIENLEVFEGTLAIGNELDNVIRTHTNEPHSYRIEGLDGDDTLIGGTDSDTVFGGNGDDWLESGRAGNDLLTGGAGADRFVLRGPGFSDLGFQEIFTVSDFSTGLDRLVFDRAGFAELGAPGDFSADDERFFAGAGAAAGQDESDRLVYDTSGGLLYYDADGSGAGEAVLLTVLDGSPTLAATDITVI